MTTTCPKCGTTLQNTDLLCPTCIERASHEACLRFQHNYLLQMVNDDYEVFLARANNETHVAMVGTGQTRAFCGANLEHPSRRTRAHWSIAAGYCCPSCRDAIEQAMEEIRTDAKVVEIDAAAHPAR